MTKQDDLRRAQAIAANPANISEDLWGGIPALMRDVAARTAYRMARCTAEREDIEGACFEKLFCAVVSGKFPGDRPLEAWLATSARNEAIDLLRKRDREILMSPLPADQDEEDATVSSLPSAEPTPEDRVVEQDNAIHLRARLKSVAQMLGEVCDRIIDTMLESPEAYIKTSKRGYIRVDLPRLHDALPYSYQQIQRAVRKLRASVEGKPGFADDLDLVN